MHHIENRALFFLQKKCSKPMYYDGVRLKNILKKKKKIYTLKIVYPFSLILAIGHRKRHVIFFKQNNM